MPLAIPLLVALAACGPPPPDTGAPPGVPTGTAGSAGPTLRIATWNIESVGAPGSDQFQAAVDILRRIDADIVGLNEIDEFEQDHAQALADALGYDTVIVPSSNPFGGLRNGILARIEVAEARVHTAAELSGDPDANDVTRPPVSVSLPDGLRVAVTHCKSGFEDADEFRRTIDAIRLAQVADDPGAAVIMGDMNQEVDQVDTPATFTDIPWGMPSAYFVGADVYATLTGPGLANGAFSHYDDAGYQVVPAAQMDGSLATRNASGRRIDYVLVGAALADRVVGAEIYDSRDDGPGAGLPKAGDPPPRRASEDASDHLPVFIDLKR